MFSASTSDSKCATDPAFDDGKSVYLQQSVLAGARVFKYFLATGKREPFNLKR